MTTATAIELQHRFIQIEGSKEHRDTLEFSFSSEEPVKRYFGDEVLDHDERSVDLATKCNVDIIKIASCSSNDWPLLEKIAKVNTILIANIDGTNAADVTIEVSNDNGSTYYKLASTISVPADATLSFLENPIYLDETDLLAVTAGAANDLSFFVSYEEITD